MKIKLTKKSWSYFFEYNSVFVLLAVLLSFVGVYYSIEKIDAYKDYEQLDFFVEGDDWIDASLEDDLLSLSKDEVYQVNKYVYSPSLKEIAKLYTAYGESADILVLRKQDLVDMGSALTQTALPLSSSLDAALFPSGNRSDFAFYTVDGTDYAIQLYAQNDADFNAKYHFSSWLSFHPSLDDYYLLLNAKSNNCGPAVADAKNDAAIKSLGYLLTRYR